MQPGPAYEPYFAAVQVKISGQYGLYVSRVGAAFHWLAQFDDTAKFITAAVRRVSQYELRVVLSRHGSTLRRRSNFVCEPLHKTQQMLWCNNVTQVSFFA